MQVLVELAMHSDQVVPKKRLFETVWQGTFVGDDVLIRCISEIRFAFGDDPRSPSIIQTIPKLGYRLIAPVTMQVEAQNRALAPEKAVREYESSHAVEPISSALTVVAVLEEQPPVDETPQVSPVAEHLAEPTTPLMRRLLRSFSRRTKLMAICALILAVVAPAGYFVWKASRQDFFTTIWKPALDGSDPVLFCIPDQNLYTFMSIRDTNDLTRQIPLKDSLSAVLIDDMETIVQVASFLRSHGKDNLVLREEEKISLSDLRNGPTVFIGAFNNAWTLRLTRQLRYHFANNSDMSQLRIVDAKNPAAGWAIDRIQQLATNNYQDFAIAARFVDANTGKVAIVIAGIGRGGTVSGGEFLTNPDHLRELSKAIKANGNKPNFEIVLSTQVIEGQAGTSKMEAAYFW